MSTTGYEDQAEIYDLLYTVSRRKDYAAEARQLDELIRSRLGQAHRLLDVGCGTGLHDEQFGRLGYDVTGVDLSPRMLAAARRRLPGVTFVEASMTGFDLQADFDVVTSLFSAIGHMLTEADLHAAIATMARHVRPGGLLIVEPWLHPGQFEDGHLSTDVVRTDDIDIVRMVYGSVRGDRFTHLEMHHLVGRPGQTGGIHRFVEDMDVAVWSVPEYEAAFTAAGLTVDHDPAGLIGRGLFIGTKPDENSR
jgi:dTDP-3-amino-3,4,6-trideoxy-alpha-D-glucopyranose N,N-dimethyltransferase